MYTPPPHRRRDAADIVQPPVANPEISTVMGCLPEKIQAGYVIAPIVIFLLCVAVVVPTVFLSFHTIRYDQMAFVRDIYGKADTSQVYTQGRYFLLLTKTFVSFDRTYEPISYTQAKGNALQVALSNGVQISLDLMFEYRVHEHNLAKLYNQFSTSYLSQISTVAESTIKSVVIQFQEIDYVQNRDVITRVIGEAVQAKLADEIFVFAPAEKFQLMNVYFPESVVIRNLEASIEIQNNEIAELQQLVVSIQQETARQVAEVNAQSTQAVALAQIESNELIQRAKNSVNNVAVEARALGLQAFFNTLNVNDPQVIDQLVTYLDILDSTGNIKLLSFGNQNSTLNTIVQV